MVVPAALAQESLDGVHQRLVVVDERLDHDVVGSDPPRAPRDAVILGWLADAEDGRVVHAELIGDGRGRALLGDRDEARLGVRLDGAALQRQVQIVQTAAVLHAPVHQLVEVLDRARHVERPAAESEEVGQRLRRVGVVFDQDEAVPGHRDLGWRTGSRTMTVVPLPTSLLTDTSPAWSTSTIFLVSGRPRPVPPFLSVR